VVPASELSEEAVANSARALPIEVIELNLRFGRTIALWGLNQSCLIGVGSGLRLIAHGCFRSAIAIVLPNRTTLVLYTRSGFSSMRDIGS
jgi:hypothetical protein